MNSEMTELDKMREDDKKAIEIVRTKEEELRRQYGSGYIAVHPIKGVIDGDREEDELYERRDLDTLYHLTTWDGYHIKIGTIDSILTQDPIPRGKMAGIENLTNMKGKRK